MPVLAITYVVERHVGIRQAVLVRHLSDGAFGGSLGTVWYSARGTTEASLLADLQSLMNFADDVLAPRGNKVAVVTLGDYIRVERLQLATLVVVTQPPHTCNDCSRQIEEATHVLQRCKCFLDDCDCACSYTRL